MFCLKCGEAIPDESKSCPKCGADLTETANDEQFVVYASQNTEMPNVSGSRLSPSCWQAPSD